MMVGMKMAWKTVERRQVKKRKCDKKKAGKMKGGRRDKMFEEFRKISSRPVWRKMVFGMVAAIQFSFANSHPGSGISPTLLSINPSHQPFG